MTTVNLVRIPREKLLLGNCSMMSAAAVVVVAADTVGRC